MFNILSYHNSTVVGCKNEITGSRKTGFVRFCWEREVSKISYVEAMNYNKFLSQIEIVSKYIKFIVFTRVPPAPM